MRCKNCKNKFDPKVFLQKYCMKNDDCIRMELEYKTIKLEKSKKKAWAKEKRQRKERIKTIQDHVKEVQIIFNKFIRLRDANKPCISCQRHHKGQYHAGHYRSVGGNPELRFVEINNNKQCAPCNNHLSGNLINYRINLIKKIGIKKVEWLEGHHEPKHYTIDQLNRKKAIYKLKIKTLILKTKL